MAEDLKAEYKKIQESKRPKNEDTIEVDEFEWVQLNKELLLNRDSGKPHKERPQEKLIRKFSENPLIPIGARRG